jgi:hypothetical protein
MFLVRFLTLSTESLFCYLFETGLPVLIRLSKKKADPESYRICVDPEQDLTNTPKNSTGNLLFSIVYKIDTGRFINSLFWRKIKYLDCVPKADQERFETLQDPDPKLIEKSDSERKQMVHRVSDFFLYY